jgi:hypothetical protein
MPRLAALQRDLDAYLTTYNFDRAHTAPASPSRERRKRCPNTNSSRTTLKSCYAAHRAPMTSSHESSRTSSGRLNRLAEGCSPLPVLKTSSRLPRLWPLAAVMRPGVGAPRWFCDRGRGVSGVLGRRGFREFWDALTRARVSKASCRFRTPPVSISTRRPRSPPLSSAARPLAGFICSP